MKEQRPIPHEIFRNRSAPQTILIRQFRENDREAVRAICCDTGFLGRPIDAIYRDRPLFADLLTNPYLDYQPDMTLVAEAEGVVVGYLMGSIIKHFDLILMRSGFRTAAKMLIRLLAGKYAGHPRSEQFVRWVFTKGLKERPKHPEHAGHLHLNLNPEYRGIRIAKCLWETFEDMLRAKGVGQYYGEFYSYGTRRLERIYSRYGLKVFDRCATTIFHPEIPDTVLTVCMSKNL